MLQTNTDIKGHVSGQLNVSPYKGKGAECNEVVNHAKILSNSKPLECIFCPNPRSFGQKSHLFRHLLSHIKEKPLICQKCGDEKGDNKSAKNHYLRFHSDARPHNCAACQKVFYCLSSLRCHERHFHSYSHPRKKSHEREICRKTYTTKLALRKHRQLHSGTYNPFKCYFCEKAFPAFSDLNVHTRTHTGERPFKCDKCLKAFATSTTLSKHVRTHSALRKMYPCPDCGKDFLTTVSLKVHIRSLHGRSPKCLFCNKKVSRPDVLCQHLLTHIKEKPHICKICGHESRCAESARYHYQRYHQKKLHYNCEVCGKGFVAPQNLRVHLRKMHDDKRVTLKPNLEWKEHLLFN